MKLAGPLAHAQVIRPIMITKNTYNSVAYPLVITACIALTLMEMVGMADISKWIVQDIARTSPLEL